MVSYWQDYGIYEQTPIVDSDTISVAKQVLDKFNIPYTGIGGGPLSGIDLKHVPSLSAINMSLAEETAQGGPITELVIDAYGRGTFVDIGSSNMSTNDLYHSVTGEAFNYTTTNCVVTGKKLPLARNTKTPYNLLQYPPAKIWDDSSFLQNCYADKFRSHAIITFPDPHMDANAWGDGVDSIYDPQTPWENVITWIWDIDPGNINAEASVSYSSGCTVPLRVSGEDQNDWKLAKANLGTLYRRTPVDEEVDEAMCQETLDRRITCDNASITVNIEELAPGLRYESFRGTQVDNYKGVKGVYFVGWEIDSYWSRPKTDLVARTEAPTVHNSQVTISLSDTSLKLYQLREGDEYAVGYDEGKICIKFANNSPPGDKAYYGTEVDYKLSVDCSLWPESQTAGYETGSIFPLSNRAAILVEQVFVLVELDSPCFVINDPLGGAIEIAEQLQATVAAVTKTEEPAPIAINGELVDHTDGVVDSDPTTTQDLTDTHYERLLRSTDSGPSIDINIATLTESETLRLSTRIRDIIETDEGILATHVFGPSGAPSLGDKGLNGGVINSVTYNYSDSSAYTISAQEGPRLNNGLTSIGGGPHVKTTGTYSNEGTIIQDEGNGVKFKVMVEGYGTVDALNGTPQFIRVGDRCQTTIYNVPAEA